MQHISGNIQNLPKPAYAVCYYFTKLKFTRTTGSNFGANVVIFSGTLYTHPHIGALYKQLLHVACTVGLHCVCVCVCQPGRQCA